MGEIVIVGLGPGSFKFMTLETLEILQQAQTLLLRTAKHPTVAGLLQREISFASYDEYYERHETFEQVYAAIAEDCVARALAGEKIVYAVPGSPLVAERTVILIRELARAKQIPVTILPGMSFLEVLYTRLGVDPIEGLSILDACDLAQTAFATTTALVITQVYNQTVASDVKLTLMDSLPDDYEVTLVRGLGLPEESIRRIPLYELDRQADIDHLTSLYVPKPEEKSPQVFSLEPLVSVMAELRSPEGCLWDLEQNHKTLRRYLVEEVYEVLEAIELADSEKLCEELGDLLLQIVFHARVAEESGEFGMQDVVDVVTEKMIRRHPHVFGEVTVADAADVVVNWEEIKRREHSDRKRILDGIPAGLPALMHAYKVQGKAAKVGFDWPDAAPVWEKVAEELQELREAVEKKDAKAIEEELGDALFSLVNLARFLSVEPETALTATNQKFRRRFGYIEEKIMKNGEEWKKMSLKQLDLLWNEAKKAGM
ncbi:nucleoside triphosphate pyrophosphohydrolase [Azotosporobacter soli]|uniref:nucleoside triphosphate pyrophosphohydrolase n=1 Tax=Azotosporobacter soli TaxID=3055040 RepID=UPI0031FECB9F